MELDGFFSVEASCAAASEPMRGRFGDRSPFVSPGSCEAGGSPERPWVSSSGSLDRFRPFAVSVSRRVPAGLPARGILVFSVPSSAKMGVVG